MGPTTWNFPAIRASPARSSCELAIDTNALSELKKRRPHGLTLVTRNLGDFRLPLLRVVNPWDEPARQT